MQVLHSRDHTGVDMRRTTSVMIIMSVSVCEMCFLPTAAPPEAFYAPTRVEVRSVDEPMSPEEEAMDLLDFVNLRVFGNGAFREEQRRVIETVLKVTYSLPVISVLGHPVHLQVQCPNICASCPSAACRVGMPLC